MCVSSAPRFEGVPAESEETLAGSKNLSCLVDQERPGKASPLQPSMQLWGAGQGDLGLLQAAGLWEISLESPGSHPESMEMNLCAPRGLLYGHKACSSEARPCFSTPFVLLPGWKGTGQSGPNL